MGAFKNSKNRKAAQAAANAPTAANITPPWAVSSCKACKGSGWNSKGAPCRACDTVQGRSGGPTSSQFRIWQDDNGDLRWAEAASSDPSRSTKEEQTATPAPVSDTNQADDVQVSDKPSSPKMDNAPMVAKKKKATKNKVAKKKATKEAPETTTAASNVKAVKWFAEVPYKGFCLCIGCVPLRAEKGHVLNIIDVHILMQEEIIKIGGSEQGYYSMNAFDRRDILAGGVWDEELEERLKGATVAAPSHPTPDLAVLIDVLRKHASEIFVSAG